MTRIPIYAIAAASLSLALGACSRSGDEPTPVAAENFASPAPEHRAEAAPTVAVRDANASAIVDANPTDADPSASAPPPDEQILDDAAATGMTARASRGETPTNDAAAPAQPEEN